MDADWEERRRERGEEEEEREGVVTVGPETLMKKTRSLHLSCAKTS